MPETIWQLGLRPRPCCEGAHTRCGRHLVCPRLRFPSSTPSKVGPRLPLVAGAYTGATGPAGHSTATRATARTEVGGTRMPNSGSPTSFDVTAEHLNGVVRLQARGELDLSTAPLLERAFTAVEGYQPTTIVLDFQDLAFIDSTGLHALLKAHQRATDSGRLLVVINGTEGVRKVFELTGTEHLLAPSLPAEVHGALLVEGWAPIA